MSLSNLLVVSGCAAGCVALLATAPLAAGGLLLAAPLAAATDLAFFSAAGLPGPSFSRLVVATVMKTGARLLLLLQQTSKKSKGSETALGPNDATRNGPHNDPTAIIPLL